MDNIIKNAENIELSGIDLHRMTDGKAVIISYPELGKFKSLDELFGNLDQIIILYDMQDPSIGHWCCLMRIGDLVEFFDPYGLKVDQELDFTNPMHIRQEGPHLSAMIQNSGYNFVYNSTKLQEFKHHINTCGRHVAVRLRFSYLDLKKYIQMLERNKYSPDEMVSLLTLLL
jgi:hypothetical protein